MKERKELTAKQKKDQRHQRNIQLLHKCWWHGKWWEYGQPAHYQKHSRKLRSSENH